MAKVVFGIAKTEDQAIRIINRLKEAGSRTTTYPCCCRIARPPETLHTNSTQRLLKALRPVPLRAV
jgi:hypothetical protein